jgi:hypothetical protein
VKGRSGRALERGECLVDLEGLADVLGAFCTDAIPSKTARAKQGAFTGVSAPLLTTKQAHSTWGGAVSRRALESGECRVELEGIAHVLGAFCTDLVHSKAARAKQGAFTGVSTPY